MRFLSGQKRTGEQPVVIISFANQSMSSVKSESCVSQNRWSVVGSKLPQMMFADPTQTNSQGSGSGPPGPLPSG